MDRKPLRALILEDEPNDAELVRLHLEEEGYDLRSERVQTPEGVLRALKEESWDVVLSDFSMPDFTAPEALALLKETGLDLPFIIVSGTIGEERAVTTMKAGAHDFIVKDNLGRLATVIERELEEARGRKARKKAEELLRFLSESSVILAQDLDYQKTLDRVAHLAVPKLADYCLVDVVDEEGNLQRLSMAHVDPVKERLLHEMRSQYPPDPHNPSHPVFRVVKTGKPEFVSDIPDELLAKIAADEKHLKFLRELGLQSFMCLPIVLRGKALGVISFVSAESGRRYEEEDVSAAEELARRAAIAIENARLYHQAQQAGEEAKLSVEALKEALRVRDNFLQIASHELKTPVTSLKMQIQMLQRMLSPEQKRAVPPEKLLRSADISITQIDRLTALIEDLLDVSRIQAGKLSFAFNEVNLSETLRDYFDRMEEEFKRTHTPLEFDIEPGIVGIWDAGRLEQVIANLASNALKYASGKPVHVALKRQSAEQVRLSIKDKGPGISKDKQAFIFERFGRAVDVSSISGMGLGLFITKQIVEAHGGTIWVESEPEDGSVFIVELPLRR